MDEYIQKNEYKDLCLSSCVADTVSEFSELAEIKRKQLVYDGSHDIHMNGDEAQIRQLIAILLDNAVKYCDENGIITVSLKKKKRPVIIIKNTYKNVEQLRLDKLFDRFYRADQARTAGTGFGIGLSIAQYIAEHHHGTIKVEKKHEYVYSNEILEQSDILNVL